MGLFVYVIGGGIAVAGIFIIVYLLFGNKSEE